MLMFCLSLFVLSDTPQVIQTLEPSGRYLVVLDQEPVAKTYHRIESKADLENRREIVLAHQRSFLHRAQRVDPRIEQVRASVLLVNAITITCPDPAVLNALRALPHVAGIEEDRRLHSHEGGPVSKFRPSPRHRVGSATGEGVVIAIIDSGIDYSHPDLGGGFGPEYKVMDGYDFANGDADPMDDNGHGTHVAGIAAANGEFQGVASDARLYAVKVLGKGGNGYVSDIIAGLEWSVDPDSDPTTDDGALVLNMSLGGTGFSDGPLAQAVNQAVELGAVVVVSAGNSGTHPLALGTPAAAEQAITVAASDHRGAIAQFSSRGPGRPFVIKPDVAAPGVDVYSTLPGNRYGRHSGTSMSAPYVSGVAAMMRQLEPGWTPNEIKRRIMQSAMSTQYTIYETGTGLVNPDGVMTVDAELLPVTVYMGRVPHQQDVWDNDESLTLTNTSGENKTYNIGTVFQSEHLGIELALAESEFTLAPGDSRELELQISVDNTLAGFPTDSSLSFFGALSIDDGASVIQAPFALTKYLDLTVQGQDASDLSYLGVKDDWNSEYLVLNARSDVPVTVPVTPGVYQLWCQGRNASKHFIALRDVTLSDRNETVKFSSEDAPLQIGFDVIGLHGEASPLDSTGPFKFRPTYFSDSNQIQGDEVKQGTFWTSTTDLALELLGAFKVENEWATAELYSFLEAIQSPHFETVDLRAMTPIDVDAVGATYVVYERPSQSNYELHVNLLGRLETNRNAPYRARIYLNPDIQSGIDHDQVVKTRRLLATVNIPFNSRVLSKSGGLTWSHDSMTINRVPLRDGAFNMLNSLFRPELSFRISSGILEVPRVPGDSTRFAGLAFEDSFGNAVSSEHRYDVVTNGEIAGSGDNLFDLEPIPVVDGSSLSITFKNELQHQVGDGLFRFDLHSARSRIIEPIHQLYIVQDNDRRTTRLTENGTLRLQPSSSDVQVHIYVKPYGGEWMALDGSWDQNEWVTDLPTFPAGTIVSLRAEIGHPDESITYEVENAYRHGYSHYVPWVVNNASWESRISVFNDAEASTEVVFQAHLETGEIMTTQRSIDARSVRAFWAADLFPDTSGYTLMTASNTPNLRVSFLTFNRDEASEGDSPSQTIAQSRASLSNELTFGFLPADEVPAIVLSAPDLYHRNDLETDVDLQLFNLDGGVIAERTITLQGARPLALIPADLFPNAFTGHASLRARAPDGMLLTGTTFMFNERRDPSMSSAFNRPYVSQSAQFIPWVVNNPSWLSEIAIFNSSEESAQVDLAAFTRNGEHAQVQVTIEGQSILRRTAADLFPGLTGYWLHIDGKDRNLMASFVTHSVDLAYNGPSPSQTTAVGPRELSDHLVYGYLPADQNPAIVCAAPNATAATEVEMVLYGSHGELARKTMSLQAERPLAIMLETLFDTVVIEEDTSLSVRSLDETLLIGTTFIFNHSGDPSMAKCFPVFEH